MKQKNKKKCSLHDIKNANKEFNLTSKICLALKEVKLMKLGKIKAKSVDELLDEF